MESKNATMREIAKVAGVSLSTVFRVLNSDVPVSPTTRAKVIAAQQILQNKKANITAEASSRHSVGIIMPAYSAEDLSAHPSMFTIITSFVEALSIRSISNTTIVYDENLITPQDLLSQPKDGYLIIGTSEDQEKSIVPVLSEARIPCVLINRHANTTHVASVHIDDMAATTDATEHLISLGHRNIAFIGGNKNFQNTKRRLLGYQMALEKHGIPMRSCNVLFGEYNERSGYQKGKELLALPERPTAGIFASDPLAIGCMKYLSENGLHLPEDFALIGFGNIEACQYVTPTLSTVSQPSRETGIVAADVLVQMIEKPIIYSQQVRLKTNLVIRDSSGSLLYTHLERP